MGFQKNVRTTNDLTKVGKGATIVAISATFLGSVAVGRGSDPIIAYFLFLLAGIVAVTFHPNFKSIREDESLRLSAIVRPIVQSLAIGLLLMFTFVLAFRWADSPHTAAQNAGDIFIFGVIGAYVEEIIRWFWLQTLPFSVLTANGIWVLLHPQVNRVFVGKPPDLFFAAFALTFGVIMTAVMWYRETPMAYNFNLGLGPIAAATFHGLYNATVILFAVAVGGTNFGTF